MTPLICNLTVDFLKCDFLKRNFFPYGQLSTFILEISKDVSISVYREKKENEYEKRTHNYYIVHERIHCVFSFWWRSRRTNRRKSPESMQLVCKSQHVMCCTYSETSARSPLWMYACWLTVVFASNVCDKQRFRDVKLTVQRFELSTLATKIRS